METKRETIDGFAYESSNGQVVIDAHPSDEQHLLAPATHAEQPLHRCRVYLKDLIPRDWLGRPGRFFVDRTVTPDGDVLAVKLVFIPRG